MFWEVGVIERIGLGLLIVLVHIKRLRRATPKTSLAGPSLALQPLFPRRCDGPGTRGTRTDVVLDVFTTHARSSRALPAALAIAAFVLGALPVTSPAAPWKTAANGAKRATKAATAKLAPTNADTAKAALAGKKSAAQKKQTGYHPRPGLAPADEYFGRLGMSVLGVRNKVKDLGLDADAHPEHDKAILSSAVWVEDAMRDWAKKYPFDRWLPRYAYALEQMYERMPSTDAHKRALKQISYLTAYFPQTVYGKVGRAKLARGVPMPNPSDPPAALTDLERLALLDGKVVPTIPPAATPSPSPSPSPAATAPASSTGTPAATPSREPGPAITPLGIPTPAALPTPLPAATATPAPTGSAKP
jgi:hypothetical protein